MDPDNPSRLQGLALLKTALSPNWQGDVDQLHAQLKQICPQLNKIQELMGQADDFQANNDVASALKCLKKGLKISKTCKKQTEAKFRSKGLILSDK